MHSFSSNNNNNTVIGSDSLPLFNTSISKAMSAPELELPARLAMISIPERPAPMPVSPGASPPPTPQRSHSGKRLHQMTCGYGFERKPPQKTRSYKKRRLPSTFRRVHFQHNPESGRIVRRSVYGRVTLTEDEKKALWWDKPTLRKSVKHSLRMFKYNEHCEGPSFDEFLHGYRHVLEKVGSDNAAVAMEDIELNLSDSPVRGLEQQIFPETLWNREAVIRKVVAAQDMLPDNLAPEQQSKLLRAASQNLTKGSRLIARLKGMGDASIAAALERC